MHCHLLVPTGIIIWKRAYLPVRITTHTATTLMLNLTVTPEQLMYNTQALDVCLTLQLSEL